MRRTVFCSLILLSLTAGQALANAQLQASEPRDGAVLAQAPSKLRLRFTEIVRLPASGVQLTYPDGRRRLLRPLVQDPRDLLSVLAPLPAGLPPGRYVVGWRALSPVAHHTHGSFTFVIGR